MLKTILLVISVLALARAQVPSLGYCPDYVPMTDFDMGKFLGVWYEAERSFQLPELGPRCAMASYTKGPDNKYHVSNMIGRFLGFQRVIDGEIILPASKAEEGKLNLRYTTSLSNLPSSYHMLHTDYKNYAVMWNCNGLGPVHTENLWIMTRERNPSSETLQKAYGILDKYRISKTYLVRSDQTDCKYAGFDDLPKEPATEEDQPEMPVGEEPDRLRSAVIINDAEIENENKESAVPVELKSEPIKQEKIADTLVNNSEPEPLKAKTVAEVISEIADNGKEQTVQENSEIPAAVLPKISPAIAMAEAIEKPVDAPKEEPQQAETKN